MATVYCPSCADKGKKVVLLQDLILGWFLERCKECGALIHGSVDPREHVDAHILSGKKPKVYSKT